MEFINDDWDSQPRARRVHSRSNANATTTSSSNHASPSLPHAAACAAASVLLLAAVYYRLLAYQVIASILIWIASSLLLAPFAPSPATGGDVSVGRGRLLPDQEPPKESTPDPAPTSRRPRHQNPTPPPTKPSDPITPPIQSPPPPPPPPRQPPLEAAASGTAVPDGGESEWTNQDMELLRRQMVKHPAGEPQRWEKIAAAFGGRRTPESIICAAKSGAAAAAGGTFEQFLRKRKPLDPRAEAADAGGNAGGGEGGDGAWSGGDDRALLNALKVFPKDTAMRWEKVAAAVPGKTKVACMKRVTELKRDFRSSKAASEADP